MIAAADLGDVANLSLAVLTFAILVANVVLVISTANTAKAATRTAKAAEGEVAAARDQVQESRRQTELAQKTLDAQITPVLIDEPLDLSVEQRFNFLDTETTMHPGGVLVGQVEENRKVRMSLPVLNAGKGPARLTGVSLDLTPPQGGVMPGPPANDFTRSVLPPGESARILFFYERATRSDPDPPWWDAWNHLLQYGTFSVRVRYTDLGGRQDTISHYVIQRRTYAHYGWEVSSVMLEEPPAS